MSLSDQSNQPVGENTGPVDPRSVCNLMLDVAGDKGAITNLALQKLLYFAHGLHLIRTKRPLVLGYFEAWQFGPVHPAAYRAFKSAGDAAIRFRAVKRDPLTGSAAPIDCPTEDSIIECVHRVMSSYGRMSPGRLVDISHAKVSPWRVIVDKARTDVSLGLRITDDLIVERFKHHKISVGPEPIMGEPGEDAPFNS